MRGNPEQIADVIDAVGILHVDHPPAGWHRRWRYFARIGLAYSVLIFPWLVLSFECN
jgi:hypothetical protein